MTTYTLTTHINDIVLTRIEPLSRDIVRFSMTVEILGASTRFSQTMLALYGSLLLTKTRRKNKQSIESYKNQYGIDLTITTGIETITFSGSVREEHVDKLAHLLSELIFEPVADSHEFLQKKKLALELNREAHDDAKKISQVLFINSLYQNEPRLTIETLDVEKKNIKSAKVDAIKDIQTAVRESTWYITIVGTPKAEYMLMTFVRKLAETSVRHPRTPITAEPSPYRFLAKTVPGKTNIEVNIGNVCTIKSNDPSFVALNFGIDVLGKVGGFSGRLMSTVREKEGLTYGIYAYTNPHHFGDSFHFRIRTFFMAKDYERGIASTLRELRTLVEKGVTQSELSRFKEILKNEYVLAHESNKSRLAFYHNLVVHGHNEAQYRDQHQKIASITRNTINDAISSNIRPEALVIAAAGPISETGSPILTGNT